MARQGPITRNTSTIALGLAQIRIGNCANNVNNIHLVLTSSDSIGALANTRYVGMADWYRLESGYPLIEDYVAPIREAAHLECAFKEITPFNMALAHGIDPTDGSYAEAHSGEVALGGRLAPDYIRMEAVYTFPDGTHTMNIIFPRAQVSASVEMDLQAEDAAAVAVTIESKNASSDVSGGSSVWDDKPLGRLEWL
uniref:Uncharacterized protein n=1 Tax=viral metagenome TaxID=1070528 RepID=A0A6M3KHH2_9ZZZZ